MNSKRKKRLIGWCLLIHFAIIPAAAWAVPGMINYQGYLTDEQGNPSNGNVAITFRIWDAQVAGTALWSESYALVTVSEGIFNVILGSSVPINGGILNGDRYLGITVGTDSEMTPRMRLTSVAYAIRAGYAESLPAGLCINTTGGTMTGRLGVSVVSIGTAWTEAVKGELSGTSPGAGVYGLAHSQTAHGVHGGSDGSAGTGVFGEVTGTSAMGLYGVAFDSTGVNFGVRGKTNSPNGYGGYFEGRGYFSGNLGIGTTNPQAKLHVEGNIRIPSNTDIINADGRAVFHTGWSGVFGDYSVINSGYDWGSGEPVSMVAGSNGIFFTKGDASGTPYAVTMASISTSGRFTTQSLQITGGSDIAEPFDIKKSGTIEAGMLMAIDPDHPGLLKVSDRAYDTRVAGVVSGAGGINPGMILTQESSTVSGSTLIALSGRVYCLADATYGAIQPGDMLTTSDVPGYAMKARDRERSFGSVIGKAMTPLDKGTGLVLVLVNLQ